MILLKISRVGVTLKDLKEKEPIVHEKLDLDSARIGKLENIITNLGSAFSSMKNTQKPLPKLPSLFMFLKIRVNLLIRETRISIP